MRLFARHNPLYLPVKDNLKQTTLEDALAKIRLMPNALLDGGITRHANSANHLHRVRGQPASVRKAGTGPEIAALLLLSEVPVATDDRIVYQRIWEVDGQLRVSQALDNGRASFLINGSVLDPKSKYFFVFNNRMLYYRYAVRPQILDLRDA